MSERFREFFSEAKVPYMLYVLALIAHLVVFYALFYSYGPCSFILSNDCSVSGNDTQHYAVIAENLSHGNGYSRFVDAPYEPDALRTPLLPLYFTPFTYFGGYGLIWLAILILNLLLPVAAPIIYKLARFFVPHSYARVAGLIMAFEPIYLYRSQIAEPDALFVLLLALAMFFLVRSWKDMKLRDTALCAFMLGLAVLAKPSAQYVALLVVIFEALFLFVWSRKTSDTLKHFAVLAALPLLVVAPWMLRNKIVFGVAQLSSIQGYNLYAYYTADIPLPNEFVPESIQQGSREPSRYLPFQSYFVGVSVARIKVQPLVFAKALAVGMFRNLFVSDISAIYYYGHTKLLPLPYDPESGADLHGLLEQGDIVGVFKGAVQAAPKLAWAAFLLCVYLFAFAGWIYSWKADRKTFLAFTLFFAMYGYLIASSGPYVEAKYRLPASPLIVVVALYGVTRLQDLRTMSKGIFGKVAKDAL